MGNYLIIGGSSGIGRATCENLLEEGHSVYASYNNGSIELTDPNFKTFHWSAENSFIDIDILPNQLDGFVYCPGTINLKPFHRVKPNAFLEDYQIQVGGAIQSLQNVLPLLKNSESASVVFYSSIAVQRGFTFHSLVSSSKGAIEGLMRSLAAEYAPAIRFNCVAPSITQTRLSEKLINTEAKLERIAEQHPMKRIGNTNDIAGITSFLLSDKASWITGQVIHVDGGKSNL